MADEAKIKEINKVIQSYFENNASETIVPVKKMMPEFIKAGIFSKDIKHGKPIRDILRELDKNDALQQIPYVHVDKSEETTGWYFVPSSEIKTEISFKNEVILSKRDLAKQARSESDNAYILNLCDTVLGKKAVRQKRFDFLLGDFHKDGKTRTKLPVDAYYKAQNLVIEQVDAIQPVIIEKRNKKTVSGVGRAEQNKIYEKRKTSVLKRNKIKVISISFSDFKCDETNKIIRNLDSDLEIVKAKLKDFIQ